MAIVDATDRFGGRYTIPENRKIKLARSSDNINGDWRKNLSSILTNSSTSNILGSSLSSNLDVNPNVCLTFDKDSPDLKLKVPLNTPLAEFVNNNDTVGKLATAANIATNAVDSALNINSSSTKTASSFTPWALGVPTWDNAKAMTDNRLNFNYTFEFALGQFGIWNAKEEVVKPILNLAAPTIIQELGSWTARGPYPSGPDLLIKAIAEIAGDIGSKGLGNWFQDTFKEVGSASGFINKTTKTLEAVGEALEKMVLTSYSNFTYDISFGSFLTFRRLLIVDSNLQFSNKVDEEGYPVKGSVTLTFEGIIPVALQTTGAANKQAVRFGGI